MPGPVGSDRPPEGWTSISHKKWTDSRGLLSFNGFYSPDAKSINDIAGPFDTVSIGGGLLDAIELQAASGATANEVGLALPYVPCGAGAGYGALNVTTDTNVIGTKRF